MTRDTPGRNHISRIILVRLSVVRFQDRLSVRATIDVNVSDHV